MSRTKALTIITFNLLLVAVWGLVSYFCWIAGLVLFIAQATVIFCTNLGDDWIDDFIDVLGDRE